VIDLGINAMLSSYINGIYFSPKYNIASAQPGKCEDRILTHELAHYFISPAPVSSIYNEGLSYFLENTIVSMYPINKTHSSLILNSEPTIYYYNLGLRLKEAYADKAVIEMGLLNNGQWEVINPGVEIELGKASTTSFSQIDPIIHVKEINLSASYVVVDLYSQQVLKMKLKCNQNGFQDKAGWINDAGETIYADASIAPTIPYKKFEDYLVKEYSLDYLKSAACFWEDVSKVISIKQVVTEMRKYSNFDNQPFPLFEYLQENGVDAQALISKYNITITAQDKPYFEIKIGDILG
jgi:hypothetical protein